MTNRWQKLTKSKAKNEIVFASVGRGEGDGVVGRRGVVAGCGMNEGGQCRMDHGAGRTLTHTTTCMHVHLVKSGAWFHPSVRIADELGLGSTCEVWSIHLDEVRQKPMPMAPANFSGRGYGDGLI